MALIMNYHQPQFEITIPNCYWKIELNSGIQGGKEKLSVRVSCYKDKTVADTNENKYSDFDFDFVPDLNSNTNFIAQAYNVAKTLPFFSGAVDV